MGDWKAQTPKPGGPWELYNLKTDPRETANVASENPGVLAKIKAIAAREHTPEREYPDEEPRLGVADFVR
jgi:arylsulfatase A